MRAHNGEHSDSLPVLDVSAMKHIAYVFDALIYFMRAGNEVVASAAMAGAAAASASADDKSFAAESAAPPPADVVDEEATNDSTAAGGAGTSGQQDGPQPMDLDDSITGYDNEASNQSRPGDNDSQQAGPSQQVWTVALIKGKFVR